MTESKMVIINLKQFVEDLLIAFSSNDEDEQKALDEKFKHFYNAQTTDIKRQVLNYVNGSRLVMENQCMTKYFSQFSM